MADLPLTFPSAYDNDPITVNSTGRPSLSSRESYDRSESVFTFPEIDLRASFIFPEIDIPERVDFPEIDLRAFSGIEILAAIFRWGCQ